MAIMAEDSIPGLALDLRIFPFLALLETPKENLAPRGTGDPSPILGGQAHKIFPLSPHLQSECKKLQPEKKRPKAQGFWLPLAASYRDKHYRKKGLKSQEPSIFRRINELVKSDILHYLLKIYSKSQLAYFIHIQVNHPFYRNGLYKFF